MRWKQIRQKCYACSMPLGVFHMPLAPHTAGGGGGDGDGECNDDRDDDEGDH